MSWVQRFCGMKHLWVLLQYGRGGNRDVTLIDELSRFAAANVKAVRKYIHDCAAVLSLLPVKANLTTLSLLSMIDMWPPRRKRSIAPLRA